MATKADNLLNEIMAESNDHLAFIKLCLQKKNELEALSLTDRKSVIKFIRSQDKAFREEEFVEIDLDVGLDSNKERTPGDVKLDFELALIHELNTMLNDLSLSARAKKALTEIKNTALKHKDPVLTVVTPAKDSGSFVSTVINTATNNLSVKPVDVLNAEPLAIVKGSATVLHAFIEFIEFPISCLMHKLNENHYKYHSSEMAPEAPWKSKHGWTKFILSAGALGVGIAMLAVPGVGVALGIAVAGISLAKAALEVGKTIHERYSDKKRLAEVADLLIEVESDMDFAKEELANAAAGDPAHKPEEELWLENMELRKNALLKEQRHLTQKITSLSSREKYFDIAEKSIRVGAALLTVVGAAVCLANPITGSIIGAVALGALAVVGVTKLIKFIKEKRSKTKSDPVEIKAEAVAEPAKEMTQNDKSHDDASPKITEDYHHTPAFATSMPDSEEHLSTEQIKSGLLMVKNNLNKSDVSASPIIPPASLDHHG